VVWVSLDEKIKSDKRLFQDPATLPFFVARNSSARQIKTGQDLSENSPARTQPDAEHGGGNTLPERQSDSMAGGALGMSDPSPARAAGGDPGGGIENNEVMVYPLYKENAPPTYPAIARHRGYEGEVLLVVEILPNGRVGQVKIKKSSGYAILDQSALEAVKPWKFEPAKKSGTPMKVWVDLPIKFMLTYENPKS
jgi:protein TonB